jgi:aspartate-semialdehyde dehydrogenase
MNKKIPIGILGATGVVGQRFIQMLEHHPWFEVAWLAASDRSEGKIYEDAARWRLKTPIPAAVAKMKVSPATPEGAPKIIFAALDSAIAAELEPRFADAGCAVVSNSSALRMQEDVPLVIPEVNAGHIKLIDIQGWRKKHGGYVVTNPNCSAIGLVLALAPLHQKFELETVMAVTMQAVSGAGYPGVASLDILGNVIPFIKNEEEKMEETPGKPQWLKSHTWPICHERTVQPRGCGRRSHRVGLDSPEEESEAGRNHRSMEQLPSRAAKIEAPQRSGKTGGLPRSE